MNDQYSFYFTKSECDTIRYALGLMSKFKGQTKARVADRAAIIEALDDLDEEEFGVRRTTDNRRLA